MKSILSFILFISFPILSNAQCDLPSPYIGNTGSNMTIMLTGNFLNALNYDNPDAYLLALSSSGEVLGSSPIDGLPQTTIAIWGDDTQTEEIDGAVANELISFQLIDGGDIYSIEMASPITYHTNGLAVQNNAPIISSFCVFGCTSIWAENFNVQATDDDGSCYLNGCMDELACNYTQNATIDDESCTLPGCTDDTFTEYYHQGYTAGCDDGSCTKETSNLGVNTSHFINPANTGANMTIGFQLSTSYGLEGKTIAAFTDLNMDGQLTECVGLTVIQANFFSMALWGDDASTNELDGLLAGDNELIFAVINEQGNVMAFNISPEFPSYTTNGLFVVTDIDFNVTIYGCMDSDYCNFNADAEQEDGSCFGLPGCIDDHFVEFDTNAFCSLEGACTTSWQAAFINEVENSQELQANLDNANLNTLNLETLLETTISEADIAAAIAQEELNNAQVNAEQAAAVAAEELNNTIEAANQAQIEATTILNNTIESFNQLENGYLVQIAELEEPIYIEIMDGWNNIGYTRKEQQDVVATLEAISSQILIVKNNNAEVYWPEFGFNGIGDLIPGQGYQIKTDGAIPNYFFPNSMGERLSISETIPQWVIDMEPEMHPNDIRSLVKVVNLLGQEINPEDSRPGTTLIYLYNDASVEKKIK